MPLPITNEEKIRLIHKIFYLFVEHGIDGISMDEVAKCIKVSKATIYKYFKSKEDIVRDMVNEIIVHFNTLQFTTDNGINGILESISKVYFKAVLATASSSSKFIADLESKFPDIYSDYIIALESFKIRFVNFYECAIRQGYCKKISIDIVIEQIKMTLAAIINSTYLTKHNTSLAVVVTEYYKLLLYQLLSAEYITATVQDSSYLFVNKLIELLENNFLIS